MDISPYFGSRTEIGQRFAKELSILNYQNTAILALSPGGVIIAVEIAKKLHSIMGLLLIKHIRLPGDLPYGMINDHGSFTTDRSITISEAEEFKAEYRNAIEHQKMEAMHKLHIVGREGVLKPDYFKGKNVIVINDISKTGTSFQAALDFLKTAELYSVTLVAAVASEEAADTMNKLGDRVLLAHKEKFDLPAEHYFANNEIPQTKALVKMMEQVILQW
jgi:predicted phosphoribosyltransferase